MNKGVILETICVSLILLFGYTAVSKFIHYQNFINVMNHTPSLRSFSEVLAITLPVSELIAVGLLMIPKLRRWGLYVSFVLMAAFTGYVFYVSFFADHVPCVCGGIIRQMSWKQHLVFNSFFTGATLLGIWLQKKQNIGSGEITKPNFV